MRRGRSSLWPHPLNPPPLPPSTHSPTQTEAQLIVDRGFVGQIVGKGGVNVTAIRTQTGANINTMPPAQRNPLVAPEEQLIKVRGRWEGGLVVEWQGVLLIRMIAAHNSSLYSAAECIQVRLTSSQVSRSRWSMLRKHQPIRIQSL